MPIAPRAKIAVKNRDEISVRTRLPRRPRQKGHATAHAYDALRNDIISLALPPGAPLDEADVARRLAVSRTPLREALVRLAGEGLVALLPNRGARVATMTWDDIREHLEAFEVMQRLVTRWAAARRSVRQLDAIRSAGAAFETCADEGDPLRMNQANWQFHATIAQASGNSRLEAFYVQSLTENMRITRLAMTSECFNSLDQYNAHLATIRREHRDMVRAIERQDCDRADDLGRSHAKLAKKRVTEALSQSIRGDMELKFATPIAD
jgi:DNA-binding GntR family transcriptional regulator